MARIEKTIFISYRRKDISWALAVYQYLASQKYDVFFDFTHIPSGDFEQIIVSNIKARAHFVLILTPDALDRTSNKRDWLRREIETAMDERRNIVPLLFDGFSFGSPNVAEKLVGKLANVKRYNGLEIPSGYFPEAMERLRTRYLSVPLNAVIHPVSTEVRKKIREEKVAANKALREQKEEIQEIVKPAQETTEKPKQTPASTLSEPQSKPAPRTDIPWKPLAGIVGVLAIVSICIWGGGSLLRNLTSSTLDPTRTSQPAETEEPQLAATNTPSSTEETLGIGSTMTGSDGMTLHYVPAGEFIMGSEDGSDDEKPIHTVDLDAFWIDQTEVTNVMFADFIDETGYTTDAEKAGTSWVYQDGDWNQVDGADWMHPFGPSSGISDIINHPVIHISWNDAQAYCSWADRRLPTEAEWEKAARGAEGNVYPWGDTFDGERLNFCDSNCSFDWADKNADDDYEFTAPVGTYPNGASPYGALDMAGNVWEWVNDWYDAYPGNTVSDDGYGTTYRVLRGGAWSVNFNVVRSAIRLRFNPTDAFDDFGFRCSRSP